MNTYSFRKDLLAVQEELLRFVCKLAPNLKPDTYFKGWVYTIMHSVFLHSYRKIVSEQPLADRTDYLYHLSLPQEFGFADAGGGLQPEGDERQGRLLKDFV